MSGDIPQSSFTLISPRFKRLSREWSWSWIQCHPVAMGNGIRATGGKSCSWDPTCTGVPPSPLWGWWHRPLPLPPPPTPPVLTQQSLNRPGEDPAQVNPIE